MRLPDLNQIIAYSKIRNGKWNKYAGVKKKYTDAIRDIIFLERLKPYTDKIFLQFAWFEPNRKKDPDNVDAGKKFILDGMVKAGLIPNDTQKYIGGWISIFMPVPQKKSEVGVKVSITSYENMAISCQVYVYLIRIPLYEWFVCVSV
jgi:hypothetical protein